MLSLSSMGAYKEKSLQLREISCLPLLDLCGTSDRQVCWIYLCLGYSGSHSGMFGGPVHSHRSGRFAGLVAPLPVFIRS